MPTEHAPPPLAYLLTFHTYASWLHGHDKGSVDRTHNRFGADFAPADPGRLAAMRSRSKAPSFRLGADHRRVVRETLSEVSRFRSWDLLALHVRTNHVHAVVAADATPERVMNNFKSWATRRLREAGLVNVDAPVWSRHGSTRYLWDERAVSAACRYVIEGQGVDLD